MVIVKPFKLYMFYSIFMALYHVIISMSIFTFKVCWAFPCGQAFYFSGTIQMIRGASQVICLCMVWVSLSRIFEQTIVFVVLTLINFSNLTLIIMLCNIQEGFLHNGITSFLLKCRLVLIGGGGKLVFSLIALLQISFSAYMMPKIPLKISYLYFVFC